MRRIGRWMLNGLTVLSLVLCVAVVVLWVRSYWVQDRASFLLGRMRGESTYERYRCELSCVQGVNILQVYMNVHQGDFARAIEQLDKPLRQQAWNWRRTSPHEFSFNYNPDWRGLPLLYRLGFRFSHSMHDSQAASRQYAEARLPDWAIALVTAFLPLIFLARLHRRRRNLRLGLCPSCRYDLTANISGVCPECGMKIAEAK